MQLLFGIEPVPNLLGSLRLIDGAPYRTIREFRTRLDIATRSVDAGVLKPDRDRHLVAAETRFFPRNFLEWANSIGWNIPDALASLLYESKSSKGKGVDNWSDVLASEANDGLPVSLDHHKIIELWHSGRASQDQKDKLASSIEKAVLTGELNATVLLRDPDSEGGYRELPIERWQDIRGGWYGGAYVSYRIHREDFWVWLQGNSRLSVPSDSLLSKWRARRAISRAIGKSAADKEQPLPASGERQPGNLTVIVDNLNETVTVFSKSGPSKGQEFKRADVVGKGTVTWDLLVDVAKCKGSLEGNAQAEVKERNTSANRKNLGEKLVESFKLNESPFVEGRNGVMKFASISLAGGRSTTDALDRKIVSRDDQTTEFLARQGVDMPVIK